MGFAVTDPASGACDEVSQVFSGVDIDRWAEAFLQTVDAVDDDALAAVKSDSLPRSPGRSTSSTIAAPAIDPRRARRCVRRWSTA